MARIWDFSKSCFRPLFQGPLFEVFSVVCSHFSIEFFKKANFYLKFYAFEKNNLSTLVSCHF